MYVAWFKGGGEGGRAFGYHYAMSLYSQVEFKLNKQKIKYRFIFPKLKTSHIQQKKTMV